MRKRFVGRALQALQDHSRKYTGGAPQFANVVMVLCGDCNLTEELGQQAVVSLQLVRSFPPT